jgi:hypothetical protein
MRAACIFLSAFLLSSASGCAMSDASFIKKNTGIVTCKAAEIRETGGRRETGDAWTYSVRLKGECRAKFISSAYASSHGECEAMLSKQGGCFYQFANNSVILSKIHDDTEYELRIWH